MRRVFLLSPASSSGERARMLLRRGAAFPLAMRVREEPGAPIGEVFAFLSGLYFRGKLAYARAFEAPPEGAAGILVITPNRGLVAPEEHVTAAALRSFARIDIQEAPRSYLVPFTRDAERLAASFHEETEVVLLGSIATGKYADVLVRVFGNALHFPASFAGRGDMSRGGLLLRAAREGKELDYVRLLEGVRHGPRPPRLPRIEPAAAGG